MMKRSVLLIGVSIFLSVPLWAADEYPKVEVFGGFSALSTKEIEILGVPGGRIKLYGFQAQGVYNFRKNLGIAADFGGQYKSVNVTVGRTPVDAEANTYEYLLGPQYTYRHKKVSVFVHALVGGIRRFSNNYFALGIGGGFNVNINNHFAVRVVQVDWIPEKHKQIMQYLNPGYIINEWNKNTVRFGFGIVIK
jgi:hypothetical protein